MLLIPGKLTCRTDLKKNLTSVSHGDCFSLENKLVWASGYSYKHDKAPTNKQKIIEKTVTIYFFYDFLQSDPWEKSEATSREVYHILMSHSFSAMFATLEIHEATTSSFSSFWNLTRALFGRLDNTDFLLPCSSWWHTWMNASCFWLLSERRVLGSANVGLWTLWNIFQITYKIRTRTSTLLSLYAAL